MWDNNALSISQYLVNADKNLVEQKGRKRQFWVFLKTLPSEETPTQHSVGITAQHIPVWHMSTCSTCTLRHMDWAGGCTTHLPAAASHLGLKKHWHISRAGRGWLLVPGVCWKALMRGRLAVRPKTTLVRTEAEMWSPSGVWLGQELRCRRCCHSL